MDESYLYFSATLPHLEFESEPPMTDEDFESECARLLTQGDFKVFKSLMDAKDEVVSANGTVNELGGYNRDFRNELVWFRTQRAHKESGDARRDRAGNTLIIEAVQSASKEKNLLEAEKFLDRARWQHWDNYLMGQTFGLQYIIVYGLKLKILNRYQEINSLKGSEVYEEIKSVKLPV